MDINKLKFLHIFFIGFIFIFIINCLYYSNSKNYKGGENCDIKHITSIVPTENNIIIYYAGKIYNIDKNNLDTDELQYFSYLQDLVKHGYEFNKTIEDTEIIKNDIDNMKNKKKYSIKYYKDLTKFFNYYELYKLEKNSSPLNGWKKNLYESKNNIILMLKNMPYEDIICINNI